MKQEIKRGKENKKNNYRRALEYKDAHMEESFSSICTKMKMGQYIYIPEHEELKDNALDVISAFINLLRNHANVRYAVKEYMVNYYDLVDPSISDGVSQDIFKWSEVPDKELIEQIELRRIHKDTDGIWRKSVHKYIVEDETIE